MVRDVFVVTAPVTWIVGDEQQRDHARMDTSKLSRVARCSSQRAE
jgi:hypothetical protein